MAKTSLNKRRLKKSKGSNEDRLSNLPDDLLCQILSELSTKDSVCTSLLSKGWRNVWLGVQVLNLDIRTFQYESYLFEFLDRFLESNREQDIKSFKLIYDSNEHCHSEFVWRINEVVKRRVRHFTILNRVDGEEALVRMPLSLYSCGTLVSLTLFCVVFDDPESKLVSLPCVKTMHLEAVKFDGNKILGTLISSCSVLKELVIVTHPGDLLGVVCVCSQSLKMFELESTRGDECEEDERQRDPKVVIDAPSLEYMSISRYQTKSFIIHRLGSYAKVNIDVIFDVEYDDPLKIAMIQNFLIGISTVREMIISARTLKVIHGFSELEQLPQFSNLSHLDVSFIKSFWELLPTFLGCCLNLQSLILELDSLPERDEMKVSYVPQCFISSLEFVQLYSPTTITKPSDKMKLPIYFVRNCAVLKKFVLNGKFGNIIRTIIKRIPKLSQGCEVVMGTPTYEGVSHKDDLLSIMYQ